MTYDDYLKHQEEERELALRSYHDSEIIYCWPYTAAGKGRSTALASEPVVIVVGLFAVCWLLYFLFVILHVRNFIGSFWIFFKYLPLAVLPLLGTFRRLTHLRLDVTGIHLEKSAGLATLASKSIPWSTIESITVQLPKKSSDVLKGVLVIQQRNGTIRIPLKKINSDDQWRKFVDAVNYHVASRSVRVELDPDLLQSIGSISKNDASYTKLWLEALTAPPRRERLQPLLPGAELQKGAYRVEHLLGTGGQGSAYLARASGDGLLVVLKEYILPVYVDVKVKRKALEDFEHEARLLSSLDHPGIVKCLDTFVEDHRAYLVLEYVSGKSMQDAVKEWGPIPEERCRRYAMELASILSYLHGQSPPVVHQDFTPDNILFCENGSLKLIDFMVAKKQSAESTTNTVVGKHHYMPPEQFRGKATTASDVYAFGASLFYMLTGKEPEPMMTQHPILVNEQVSGSLNALVESATALDPSRRYQNGSELIKALNPITSSSHLEPL